MTTFFQGCSLTTAKLINAAAIARLLAAVAICVVAATLFPSSAEAQVRRPSLAVSAPGVLIIYTAKGGDEPGCTSEVEYRTPPGTGTADGTVNVTLNTGNKGDYYRFTSAELTAGNSYDFRVRHTAGAGAPCQPHNTWSGWSQAFTFKGKVTLQNIGAVSVTVKTATGNGDTTGSTTTTAQRGKWIALHFETEGNRRFPHGIVLQACAKRNSPDSGVSSCRSDGNFLGNTKRFHIKRGQSEAWLWSEVKSNVWFNNDTIHLRFLTLSGNQKYWQWDAPEMCETAKGSTQPCKRIQLPVVNVQSSELNYTETVTETETAQPVTETETAQPVTETETAQPVTETETTQPVTETETTQPVTETETAQPVTETETTQPVTETTSEDEEETKSPDRAALVKIYNETGGEDWDNSDNWDTSEPIRTWHGVGMDDEEEDRVAELHLNDNGLSGEFPALEHGDLPNLMELDLSANPDLHGELPVEIMNLSALTSLDISGTMLCVPEDDQMLKEWLERDELSFMDGDGCEGGDGNDPDGDEGAGEEAQDGGGGGCAIASDAERGAFQLVLVLAVFALAAAVLRASRFGVRRG